MYAMSDKQIWLPVHPVYQTYCTCLPIVLISSVRHVFSSGIAAVLIFVISGSRIAQVIFNS